MAERQAARIVCRVWSCARCGTAYSWTHRQQWHLMPLYPDLSLAITLPHTGAVDCHMLSKKEDVRTTSLRQALESWADSDLRHV